MKKQKHGLVGWDGKPLPDEVVHIHPWAYCVARPALLCAVFVVPPQMNTYVKRPYDSGTTVHFMTEIDGRYAKRVVVGKWYTVVYMRTQVMGTTVCLPFQPNGTLQKRVMFLPEEYK